MSIGMDLTQHEIRQFAEYLEYLQRWNEKINLTTIVDEEEIVVKHFVDSLALLRAENVKSGATLLDVGTGAGFPGIPLKIARPDLNITLLDSSSKKISFVRSVVGSLRLENTTVICSTLEDHSLGYGQAKQYDYIVTRALKYEVVLNEPSLLSPSGKVAAYLTHPIESVFHEGWRLLGNFPFTLPRGYGSRVISLLEKS